MIMQHPDGKLPDLYEGDWLRLDRKFEPSRIVQVQQTYTNGEREILVVDKDTSKFINVDREEFVVTLLKRRIQYMDSRVQIHPDIPEDAKMSKHVIAQIPNEHPFMDCKMEGDPDGLRVYHGPDGARTDVTEAYNKWLKTLPAVHQVVFEWMEN